MAVSLNLTPVKYSHEMHVAFPDVDPGIRPFGSKVLVQIRTAKRMTKPREEGGIELTQETQETVAYNTQVAKVRAFGPLAFKNREKLTPWPEGAWCEVGDFVWVPKFGGDKWERPIPGTNDGLGRPEQALFAFFNDLDLVGKVTIDPREIIAFI